LRRDWRIIGVLGLLALAALCGGVDDTGTAATCVLVPQLRDVTVNQGLGSYSPLEYGKETLVRLYLSTPSCAGSKDAVQVTSASLTVTGARVAFNAEARERFLRFAVSPSAIWPRACSTWMDK